MKLHRDIGVSQPAVLFMLHRIREGWKRSGGGSFSGVVEVDETYFGGQRHTMSKTKRERLTGRGPVGKSVVVGAKDRETKQVAAKVVTSTVAPTLHGFVKDHADTQAKVYTDDARSYKSLPFDLEAVKHSVAEHVRGQVRTNGSSHSGPS